MAPVSGSPSFVMKEPSLDCFFYPRKPISMIDFEIWQKVKALVVSCLLLIV
jgi:hypothetical protein